MNKENIENQGWVISDCCNSKVKGVLPGLFAKEGLYICNICGNQCSATVKPIYFKKANGIYSKITYNG